MLQQERQRGERGQHRPHQRDQQEAVADLQLAPLAERREPQDEAGDQT